MFRRISPREIQTVHKIIFTEGFSEEPGAAEATGAPVSIACVCDDGTSTSLVAQKPGPAPVFAE